MNVPHLWIGFFFRWYDLWVGVYIDTINRNVYFCPVPMFGMKIHWEMERV